MLADAKHHRRGHLVTAYTDGQSFTGPSPENAEHERTLRADQLRHAEEIEQTLTEELGHCGAGLVEHRRHRDAAAQLVSNAPEFLALFQHIRAASTELRSVRRAILGVSDVLHHPLAGRVLDLVQCEEPTDGRAKYVGFDLDGQLVTAWREAMTALLSDADAPLPVRQDHSEVRGGVHAPPAAAGARGR